MATNQTSETLIIELDADRVAEIKITIEKEGLGHIDPPTHHAPTLTDIDTITTALTRKHYTIKKSKA